MTPLEWPRPITTEAFTPVVVIGVTILCAILVACGGAAPTASPADDGSDIQNTPAEGPDNVEIPSPVDTTINLNDHQQFADWDDQIRAECEGLQAFTEEFQRCVTDETVGTTLTISGPVLTTYGSGDLVGISVGSDNPRLQPWPSEPPTYVQGFVCTISTVAECGVVKQGDNVSLAATYHLSSNPQTGMVATDLLVDSIDFT